MTSRRLPLCALFALWTTACASPTVVGGSLSAQATPAALLLHNGGAEPIYYFVVGRTLAALIDWTPCRNPSTCPRVDPGETERIPWRDVPPHERGEEEVLVYCWRLVPAGDGLMEPDFLPGLTVPI